MTAEPETPRRFRRRMRLAQLLAEVGSAAQVERETGIHRSYLSALVNATRGVGDKLATKLEVRYGKPSGWFDLPLDAPAAADNQLVAGPALPFTEEHGDLGRPSASGMPPTIQDLKRLLWRLAGQLAALPEAQRKSVLYFIQQIGKAPSKPHDWIEQAGAVVQTLSPSARDTQSGKTAADSGPRDPAAKEESDS